MALPAISARRAAGDLDLAAMAAQRVDARHRTARRSPSPHRSTSAPVTSAAWNTRSMANRPASASAVENCVPLSSASPSLGPSISGASPARSSAACGRHGLAGERASPTPIIAAAMWASGARSPDAPTEPWLGTTGTMPRSSMASSSAMVCGRTPEAPWPRLASLSAIISRTIGGRHRLADAGGVRQHDVALQRRQVCRRRYARSRACRSRC